MTTSQIIGLILLIASIAGRLWIRYDDRKEKRKAAENMQKLWKELEDAANEKEDNI